MNTFHNKWRSFLKEGAAPEELALYIIHNAGSASFLVLLNTQRTIEAFKEAVENQQQSMRSFSQNSLDDYEIQGLLNRANALVAIIQISDPTKSDFEKMPCSNAHEVGLSAVDPDYQKQGYGKLIYGLAMAYVYPHGLMSDRSIVSSKAQRVWLALDKSGTDRKPIDKPPYIGQFDDIADPETPPEDDDCYVSYEEPWLNRSYTSNEYAGKLKELRRSGLKLFGYLKAKYNLDPSEVKSGIKEALYDLFDKASKG